MRRGWTRTIGMIVGGVAVAAALLVGAPSGVGAQAPPVGLLPVPDPLPAGAPGTVIDSAPFAVTEYPVPVEGHQLLYRSTDRFGAPIAVSGAVLVPTGSPAPPEGRPVVAVGHGTVGITDGCAPSVGTQQGGQLPYDRVDDLLAGGAIVVASDYPGLGTPGVHPYLDGVGAGRALLDSIRAAAAFGGSSTAVVTGFSQGGQATLFAGSEHAVGYAPDIDLRAVVPVAAPTLTSAAYAARAASPNANQYVGIILSGIVAARPDLDRSELLTPSGEAAYAQLEAIDADPGGGCSYSTFDVERDIAVDPLTLPDWNAALVANEPGSDRIDVPVLMVASDGDSTVPRYMTELVCRGLTALGTDLRLWLYDGLSHVGTNLTSADDRATWILARLAGEPPTRAVDFTDQVPEVIDACAVAEVPPGVVVPPTVVPLATAPPTAVPAVPVTGPARFTG